MTSGHEADAHQLAMDEAGNTGENLLDADQPVYALVAVDLDLEAAESATTAALGRTQMQELKFARLRQSGGGRRNILQLLDDLALAEEQAAAWVADKAWMLVAKLVDELVEARMLAAGRAMDWYQSGEARAMAETLYERGRLALGSTYDELADAFLPMVRDFEPARARTFISALQRARLVARDQGVHDVLTAMMDTEQELTDEFQARVDALDPHLPALWWHAGYWSQIFDNFGILHDESNAASRFASELAAAADARGRAAELTAGSEHVDSARSVFIGRVRIDLPVGMRDITFAHSHDDPRIQVADVVSGSVAHVYAAVTQIRPEDGFSRKLERRGIGKFIREAVGRAVPDLRRRRLGLRASAQLGSRRERAVPP
jgi:hypothetical protein